MTAGSRISSGVASDVHDSEVLAVSLLSSVQRSSHTYEHDLAKEGQWMYLGKDLEKLNILELAGAPLNKVPDMTLMGSVYMRFEIDSVTTISASDWLIIVGEFNGYLAAVPRDQKTLQLLLALAQQGQFK